MAETVRAYHVLERRFWEEAQRRKFLDPLLYKSGAIHTYAQPFAKVLHDTTGLMPNELYRSGMVELRLDVPPQAVDAAGAIRTRIDVKDCREVVW